MASMTDFVQSKLIQESANIETEMTEDQVAAAVLESYLSMTAAFANTNCICECANIAKFCESAEVEVPDNATPYMESFWDGVVDLFEKIGEWFRTIIQGMVSLFTAGKIAKLIAKLKEKDGNEEIKLDSDIVAMSYGTKVIMDKLEEFKTKFIDEIPDQKTVDEFLADLEKMNNKDYWSKGVLADSNVALKNKSEVTSMTISKLITILEDINKFDIPKRGSALLKKMEFDKTKYKATDANGEKTEDIDKELVRGVNKCARLIAKLYDKITKGLVSVSDKAYGKTEVKDKEAYDANLKEATDAHKKTKYNDEESGSKRPSADEYFK